jgi:hypothetical protein
VVRRGAPCGGPRWTVDDDVGTLGFDCALHLSHDPAARPGLYAMLAERASDGDLGRTDMTKAIETVDNDQEALWLSIGDVN